ncbi:MAG: anhydro-N-acetylmuramic acid kinase, partial [Bryobacteraceae bacterium]
GPGNMVIDALVAEHTNLASAYDKNGRLAAKGRVDTRLLDALLKDHYYRIPPPKSAGREQYGEVFLKKLKKAKLPMLDLIATATAFTAATIAVGIQRFAPPAKRLIVSGGGVHNPRIMANLAAYLPELKIETSADYGIDPDAKEAIAFAILAHETWNRRPSNLPAATGARHPVILGDITPV